MICCLLCSFEVTFERHSGGDKHFRDVMIESPFTPGGVYSLEASLNTMDFTSLAFVARANQYWSVKRNLSETRTQWCKSSTTPASP